MSSIVTEMARVRKKRSWIMLAKRTLVLIVVVLSVVTAVSCVTFYKKSGSACLRFVGCERSEGGEIAEGGLVIMTHGWIEKGAGDWPEGMALEMQKRVDANQWRCGYFDWSKGAKTLNPTEAAEHARDVAGPELAEKIVRLSGDWRHIHLIGHSCGCWVVSEAAKILAGKTKADIHLTFLDAYVPAFWEESSLSDVNAADANCWSEHYYTRDMTLGWTQHDLSFAHNVDITKIDCGFQDHNFPWKWYYGTISGKYPKGSFCGGRKVVHTVDGIEYGFGRGREAVGEEGWRRSLELPVGKKAVTLKNE